jgi:hypothetical protein
MKKDNKQFFFISFASVPWVMVHFFVCLFVWLVGWLVGWFGFFSRQGFSV